MSSDSITIIELPFNKIDTVNQLNDASIIHDDMILNYPVGYLILNDRHLYVGETTNIRQRMKDHLKNKERQKLKNVVIIFNKKFNQSATYNIETNLINNLIADKKYILQNKSQINKRVMHSYYQKELYNQLMFEDVWKELLERKIAKNSLEDIKNSDVFKLSPYKELSEEQLELKNNIIKFCKENLEKIKDEKIEESVLIIEGDAGTGKSVLLSSTFNLIQDLAHDNDTVLKDNKNNYLLVNHTEMLKSYESISESLPNLFKKNFLKPTTFINMMDKKGGKADIVLVDEAHLLLTKKDAYNSFKYDNHLEEIIKRSKITIIVYDPYQVLKVKSNWNKLEMSRIEDKYKTKTVELKNQLRINANMETLEWLDKLVSKEILDVPEDEKFDLKIFDNPNLMYSAIKEKDDQVGLSRLVSTFDYVHKKDGNDYYIEEGTFKMPWNRTYNDTWAEKKDTINEVGSIYTIQGFDLNYVGVILGPSIQYDRDTDKIKIESSLYKDTGAFSGSGALDNKKEVEEKIILNSINVLIKRGIHGLYIFASNKELREKLLTVS